MKKEIDIEKEKGVEKERDIEKEKGIEKERNIEKDENVVITMRCIDMVCPTSDIDKVPCSECGEMTWLSISFRKMKVDRIICSSCFFDNKRYKDEDCYPCVTEECLNDALTILENRGICTTKEELIITIEDKIGKELKIVKPKRDKCK